MPIIIDQNNPLEDIERINKEVNTTKHSPKFFSSKLTGEGKNTGLINKDIAILSDQFAAHSKDLMTDPYITGRVLDDVIKQTMFIGAYEKTQNAKGEPTPLYGSREAHEERFNKQSGMYKIEKTVALETVNPLLINNFSFNMAMPLDTVLWDLNNVEDWAVIDENAERIMRGKVLFSHLTLFKYEEDKGNNKKKQHYRFVLTPFLLLSVSHKNVQQDHIVINDTTNANDPTAHRVRIVPIRIETPAAHPDKVRYGFGYPTHAFIDKEANMSVKDFTNNYTIMGDTYPAETLLKVNGIMSLVRKVNIHETMTEQAKRYKDSSMNQFVRIVKELRDMYGNDPLQAPADAREDLIASLYSLINQLEHIEEQGGKISTEDLNEVYESIMSMNILKDSDKDNIVRQSLRLLLAHRLDALQVAKENNQLYKFQPKNDKVTENVHNSKQYSLQQKNIILTQEPLAIGQAGAGSGKSHTVTGRIHYLQAQKEDLDKVMVLSFTNVAAQNITARIPGIKSKTLADMFHTIYTNSFPEQHLSTSGTLVNSLSLLNPSSRYFAALGHSVADVEETISRLRTILNGFVRRIGKNVDIQSNMRLLMNLVDEHCDLIMDILNATEQTTLELEPIIIHSYLNNKRSRLSIPQEFKDLNMIITDESQDISTFEYIMLIDMALDFGCQLLIVGDGSQTLYEFRNSDPRYLNALEASGVFETYKLETNYRSNPEVLAFANQILKVIEANDIAKIQLRANTLRQASVQSFKEKITVCSAQPSGSDRKSRQNIMEDHMYNNAVFVQWFYDRIDNGEQIAFLAHTRRDVELGESILQDLLNTHGSNAEIMNIVSKRTYEKKYISDVLIAVRHDFMALDPTSGTFHQDVVDLLDDNNPSVRGCFGKGVTAKHLSFMINDIHETFRKVVQQPMVTMMRKEVAQNQRTPDEVMGYLLQAMLREETRQNNMQHVLDPKQELDMTGKQVIVSTIHAAKGLEFDHTIVVHHEKASGTVADKDKMQEQLRMLFVACSRAKESQWIINTQTKMPKSVSSHLSAMYDTPMTTAYLMAVDELHEAEQAASTVAI